MSRSTQHSDSGPALTLLPDGTSLGEGVRDLIGAEGSKRGLNIQTRNNMENSAQLWRSISNNSGTTVQHDIICDNRHENVREPR